MIVNALGEFVSRTTCDGLPVEVVEAIKLRTLDVLGAALVGFQLENHKPLDSLLGRGAEATVWGTCARAPLRDAVLLNTFLAHSTYLEDGCRYTGGHPSSVVIPAALALAERERASGAALVAAIAVGYEVFLRLGRAIYPSTVRRGFKSTAVLGAVSAAAACASLLRLDPNAAKNALAIACTLGVGLKEALWASRSEGLQVAHSCEGGVLAALFARNGAQGADTIVEGGFLKAFADGAEPDEILAGLGEHFHIAKTYLKVHAGCRGNHASIDVVEQLVRAHAIDPNDIDRIEIRVDSVTLAAVYLDPRDGEQAQFSIAFSIAVLLLNGDAGILQFNDATLRDARIRALMGKIRVEADLGQDKSFPAQRGATAAIFLRDGRLYRGSIDNARGEPENPLTRVEVEDKFVRLTRDILDDGGQQVREMVGQLERLPNIRALVKCLRGRPVAQEVPAGAPAR